MRFYDVWLEEAKGGDKKFFQLFPIYSGRFNNVVIACLR
jgi:hypothetical protein